MRDTENSVVNMPSGTQTSDELRAEIAWRRVEIDQHTNRIRDIEFELQMRDAVAYAFNLAGGKR